MEGLGSVGGDTGTGQESASSNWGQYHIQVRNRSLELEHRGSLAGDESRIVECVDVDAVELLQEVAEFHFSLACVGYLVNNGVVGEHRLSFQRINRLRYHDVCLPAEQLARERDPLGMVAGRDGHDGLRLLCGFQHEDGMVGPAKLEGADTLEVLAFQEDPRAGSLVQLPAGQDRRGVRDTA